MKARVMLTPLGLAIGFLINPNQSIAAQLALIILSAISGAIIAKSDQIK